MDFITEITNTDVFQIIFKLLLSSVLAGIIGIERSALNKPAGFGTHAIIGLSSALVVMGSQYMGQFYDIDVARIPAQILTGIGFIGAGTIIQNGYNVKGVTTAAGILSVTCIGLAVGVGYYLAAIVATLIVFLILSINHEVAGKVERIDNLDLLLTIEGDLNKTISQIKEYVKDNKISIQSISKDNEVIKNKKSEVLRLSLQYDNKRINKNDIISSLVALETITEITEE